MEVKDKIIVVTGAASGIGRATALRLAESGCALAICDVDEVGLRETAERLAKLQRVIDAGRKVTHYRVDVADRSAMERFAEGVVADHGHVHILINNAGVALSGTLEENSIEDLEWIVGINFWGVLYGIKLFLPHIRKEEEGHIVNLSSLFGLVGLPTVGAYCATKAAVRSLSETLAAELSDTRIGVTSVHPGGIDTRIVQNARLDNEEERGELAGAFERFGMSPEDAASRIVRAVERGDQRLLICRETYVADWLMRAFPTAMNRLVGFGYRRRTSG